jgi:hypothetical protein
MAPPIACSLTSARDGFCLEKHNDAQKVEAAQPKAAQLSNYDRETPLTQHRSSCKPSTALSTRRLDRRLVPTPVYCPHFTV